MQEVKVGMLMVMGPLEVVEPLKLVIPAFPLVREVYCLGLTQLWNFSTSCSKINKGFVLKKYEVCKSFNISPMEAYKRPM